MGMRIKFGLTVFGVALIAGLAAFYFSSTYQNFQENIFTGITTSLVAALIFALITYFYFSNSIYSEVQRILGVRKKNKEVLSNLTTGKKTLKILVKRAETLKADPTEENLKLFKEEVELLESSIDTAVGISQTLGGGLDSMSKMGGGMS